MKKAILWTLSVLTLCSVAAGAFIVFRNWNSKAQLKDLIFPVEEIATGKVGYMDVKGNIVIKPTFESSYRSLEFDNNGIALALTSDYEALIDKNGNVVFPYTKSKIRYNPNSNVVILMRDDKTTIDWYNERYSIYKLDGTMITPIEYRVMSGFEDGKAIVQTTDYRWQVIDESGNILHIFDESIKLLRAYKNMISSGYLAFTRLGDGIEPFTSMDEWEFGIYGYIDLNGNVLFEMNDAWTYVSAFQNDRAMITKRLKRNDSWQSIAILIDVQGNTVKEFGESTYYQSGFDDGIAIVQILETGTGVINTNGDWVVEPKYNAIRYAGGVITAKMDDDHYIFFNSHGAKLFECNYPCTQYMDGYFFQLKDDCFYMMDRNGTTIMQIPEGYIPARSAFYNNTWIEWKQKHVKQTQ